VRFLVKTTFALLCFSILEIKKNFFQSMDYTLDNLKLSKVIIKEKIPEG